MLRGHRERVWQLSGRLELRPDVCAEAEGSMLALVAEEKAGLAPLSTESQCSSCWHHMALVLGSLISCMCWRNMGSWLQAKSALVLNRSATGHPATVQRRR